MTPATGKAIGSHPLVSIVITTFNQARLLGATIESALAQDYPNFEVIVVDDGSTDDTRGVASGFEGRILYQHQQNQGIAGSRNTGVRLARGKYLAFLDGDDLWDPSKVSAQVRAAELHPEAGLIASNGVQFSGTGIVRDSLLPDSMLTSDTTPTIGRFMETLLAENFIPTTSQVMIPSAVLAEVGESDPRIPRASDYDLYLRIARRWPIALEPRKLTQWRYLPGSASGPIASRVRSYALEESFVVRKLVGSLSAAERAQLKDSLDSKISSLCEVLYQRSADVGRFGAIKGLAPLAGPPVRSRRSLAFIIALLLPRFAVSLLSPILRR
jgi:glycosyltransferase involved in cell wall biosynthesis